MRAADLYRRLLSFYPAEFRHQYGQEMVGAFSAQLRDARRDRGRAAQAAVWVRALFDLGPTAVQEHLHVIRQDLRHALRVLAASRGFTTVAVLSLALGIGASAAIFSLQNSVLMSTLPVRDPHELVMLTNPNRQGTSVGMQEGERQLATYEEFRQLQDAEGTFTSLMAASSRLQPIDARVAGGESETLALRLVSTSYFSTLGVPAVLGRTFDAGSEPAAGTAPHAVISHEYWQRRFGGDDTVIGRPIAFRTGVVTIVGVAPQTFLGEIVGERPDAWVPLAMQPTLLPGREWLRDNPAQLEKVMWLHVFGRLAPGVTLERAATQVNATFKQGLASYYGAIGDAATRTRYLGQYIKVREAATGASALRGSFSDPLWVLLGASGVVLLIACCNLGNLMLARATARSREMAIRLALGAGRGRLIRQLLTESACLAVAGGLAGLLMTRVLRNGLLRLVGDPTIVLASTFDGTVVLFVAGVTVVVGLALGLLPVLRVTETRPAEGLRDARGVAGSPHLLRIGRLVVVGQLALSLPLLVGAGLLVRTLVNLQNVDLGYATDDLLTVRVSVRESGYDTVQQTAALERLLEQIRALPGVRAATYSNNGLFGGDNGDQITVEGFTPTRPEERGSSYDAVGPGYFSTLGIPVVLGREITNGDRAGGRKVTVINETFAKRFFAGRNPLGLRVTQRYANISNTYEVVGVVRDSRQRQLRGEIEHRFYTPITQPAATVSSVGFIIRPRGDGAAALAAVRQVLQQTEPGMPVSNESTVSAAIDRRIAQDRLLAQLSLGFGGVALVLAAIGLYGVLSYGVSRRTNEIGLRKALGAQHGTLMAMIARETGGLVVAGLVVGGAVSYAAVRVITSRLYGLTPDDPVTFMAAIATLAAVAALATWLPAYRTTRVDPLVALRYD